MSPEQRQRRVQQLVGNPATRASIPTRYLPANLRSQREMNARLDQPVVPGSTLTNRQAGREAEATTSIRYGPLEEQYNQQLQQSQRVQQAIPQWYEQYRQLIGAAQQGIQQGYDAAQQQISALQAGTGQVAGQDQINQVNQQIASLGGQINPQNQQVAAQAAAIRAAMAGNIGAVNAALGANANAYAQNLSAQTPRHEVDAILNELTKERDIRGNQAQLARERGAYRTQARSDITNREQRSVLERAAFDLDVQQERNRVSQANAEAEAEQQQRNQDLVGPGGQYTREQWLAMSPEERRRAVQQYESDTSSSTGRGRNGARPASPSTISRGNTQFARAFQAAQRARQNGATRRSVESALIAGQPSRTRVNEERYEQLRQKYERQEMRPADARARARREATQRGMAFPKTDEIWTQVALDMAYDGHVSREAARRLHEMGISVAQVRNAVSYTDWNRRQGAARRRQNRRTNPATNWGP